MKKILRQVSNYEYVSFDMFDTLIKRNVRKPKDVFTLMQLYYQNKNVGVFDNFPEIRVAAELRARELSNKEEITLDEIYEQLTDNYSVELVADLKKLEIQMELEVCVANQDMMAIYNYCVETGKKIIIVSDMYLPQDILNEILHKNGIYRYIKLYSSSECGVRKISGNLFKYVLGDLEITKKQLIHIGDGKKNDFLKPWSMGIKSFLIPDHINHLNYYCEKGLEGADLFAYQTVSEYINNSIVCDKSSYWKVGYETLGPLLYGFSEWLLADLKEKGIKKVFFFSRDGYTMQKVFNLINDTNIETKYFYASRRALIVPLIWTHPELKDVVASMFVPKRISVQTFIKKLGLNAENYVRQLNKYDLELTTIVNGNELPENDVFLQFYEELKNDVVDNSKNEYSLLVEYLKEIEFEGDVAIVDIGWNGTMQKALCELAEMEKKVTKIVGYYTGLLPMPNRNENDTREMYGFLFQNGDNAKLLRRENCFNSIFETFFLAQHGSVEKYKKDDSGIAPILYPYEYIESDGSYSKEAEIVKEIQIGAIEFIDGFYNSKVNRYLSLSPYSAFQNMQRLGTAPHKYDAELFGDFRFYDTVIKYIAKPKKRWHYICHPKNLAFDFLNAPWRIGFMRRLFRIPLPYYEIYMQMRNSLIKKD